MPKFCKHAALLWLIPVMWLAVARCAGAEELEVRKWMLGLADESRDARKAAIESLTKCGDMRLRDFFKDFSDSKIYLWKGQLVLCLNAGGGALLDPLTREPLPGGLTATKAITAEWKELSPMGKGESNRIETARSLLGLYSSDGEVRKESVVVWAGNEVASSLPLLLEMLPAEKSPRVRFALEESIARLKLLSADGQKWTPEQLDAVRKLGELRSGRGLSRLQELKQLNGTSNPEAEKALSEGIEKIKSWQTAAHFCEHVFRGLSSGSILILMALGLSIIFGLMGVINMA